MDAWTAPPVRQSEAVLFANVVHRLDVHPQRREPLEWQWAEAKKFGLKTTTLITYPALFDDSALADAERWLGPGDELGLHFHEIGCPRILEKYGIREPVLWLWPREERMAVIDEMFEVFTKRFGHPPASIGGYIIDAWTLREIERRHPTVKTAITSCFEEGVKMYYGNGRNWLLFSDGGPWNPYFPSKDNALAPAHDTGEAIDIVAVPHLNRDMILALSSRNDWFASHPGNVFRANINEGPNCPYLIRFYKAWERQAALNGWSYLNIFVSTPWLMGTHWCIESEEDVRALYTESMAYLREREDAGAVRTVTMDEFGREFRERVQPGAATLCAWKDEMRESKREVIWLSNSHHRSAFDMARGGAMVDFRPYDGRLNLDLGPESQCLWNGNAPFLVSTEHCGGHWNTSHHGSVGNGTHNASLCDRRLKVEVTRLGESHWSVRAQPAKYQLGDFSAWIESEWELSDSSQILVRRRLVEYDGDLKALRLSEVFVGRAGTTEYPEDQRGVRLRSGSQELEVQYTGQSVSEPGATSASADIPRLGITLELSAVSPALGTTLTDGKIFSPSFRMQVDFAFDQTTTVCLKTSALKNP